MLRRERRDGGGLGQSPDRARDVAHGGERALEAPACGAAGRLAELAVEDHGEAARLAFDEIVVRSGVHRLDGDVLAHGPGQDDERHIRIAAADQTKRDLRPEPRHGVVRKHDIPGCRRECGIETLAVVDALVGDVVAGCAELTREQQSIVGRVFDEERAELDATAHFVGGRTPGVSFMTSQ